MTPNKKDLSQNKLPACNPHRPITEKQLERKLVSYCKAKGVLCYKWKSPNQRGVPDRILVGKEVAFVELKGTHGKPSTLQLLHLERLAAKGHIAEVVSDLPTAESIVDHIT